MMKISIWQQFSSNHSANFVTVGKFASSEEATEAADTLRHLLQRIDTWWRQLPPDEFEAWIGKTETPQLTPPEQEIAHEYNISWPYSLNWFHWAWDIEGPVSSYDQCVFVTAPHPYIWVAPQPFDELLTRLGAEAFSSVSDSKTSTGQDVFCNFSFHFPEALDNKEKMELVRVANEKLQPYEVKVSEDRLFVDNYVFSPWDSSPHQRLENVLATLNALGCVKGTYSFSSKYTLWEESE